MSFLWHGLTEQGAQVPVQVDAQGRVIAVDGTPGVNNWDRTNGVLSPAVSTDSVEIGSGNISLNASGSASFAGTVKADTRTAGVKSISGLTNTTSINEAVLELANGSNAGNVGNGYLISGLGPSNTQVFNVKNNGSASFAGTIQAGGDANAGIAGTKIFSEGSITVCRNATDVAFSTKAAGSTTSTSTILANGSASFAGNITTANVTFRSADPRFYVKKSKHIDALPEYVGPELDLLAEIARLEALVRHLYETLRITPPAGWPVWDGNDDVLRQLRK